MNAKLNAIPSYTEILTLNMDDHPCSLEGKTPRLDDVRVIPGKLIFKDAYDGKIFRQSFTIINCGKYSASVRILSPSSNAFKMKAIPRGQNIAAGMSITRHIVYTHNSAMALAHASILIYINRKRLIYQLEVHLNAANVVTEPKSLNFGEIDVGMVSKRKSFKLMNIGSKVSQFSMDLRRAGFLEFIIIPMKGRLEPLENIYIYVEVLGTKLGHFNKEFWIKTEPPQRMNLYGVFVEPKLFVEHPLKTFKLTLLDFPKTYFGAQSTKLLIIKNSSSTPRMFCIVIETKSGGSPIEVGLKVNKDMKCFSIKSKEGRLGARQRYPVSFTFAPKQSEIVKGKPYKNYCLVFLKIVNVQYRDYSSDDGKMIEHRVVSELEQPSVAAIDSLQVDGDEEISQTDYIHVCLYGEMHKASVKLTPESFSKTYLQVNNTYTYELEIKNMSRDLPITFRYNKVMNVEIKPKQMLLEPDRNVEVQMIIKPTKIGPMEVKVTFDLIHEAENEPCKVGTACVFLRYHATQKCLAIKPRFNWGITPEFTNEVGFLVDDIRFNSPIEKPIQAIVDKNLKVFNKSNDDLIAFPNDRARTLRPWRSTVPCRTIYAQLPRLVNEQEKSMSNIELREKKNFYTDYIRETAKKREKVAYHGLPHYDIVKEKRILLEGMYFENCGSKEYVSSVIACCRTPLSPEILMNIKITPKRVNLGKLAPYTVSTESFHIQNNNASTISIFIKAFSNAIVIKGKQRTIIKPYTTENILFECWSRGVGKYTVPVFITVNESHIFDTTVAAKVVPTTVICPSHEIVLNPNSRSEYFKIYNPVNCDVNFSWEVQDPNFQVFPLSGKISARKDLFIKVSFEPKEDAQKKTEIYLISQSGSKQVITLVCDNPRAQIGFHTDLVKFDDIPLNIAVSKELILRNFSNATIAYLVKNPNPLNEITVSPISGKIYPKSDLILTITAKFKDIVKFQCAIKFLLQNEYNYEVGLEGNVVFPEIRIEPNSIQFNKIVSGQYRRRVFRVTNLSVAQVNLNFCLTDFPGMCIADMEKNVTDSITLEASESKDLFLEFKPVEPVVYLVYLPFTINGILGPPALDDPNAANPNSYFNIKENENRSAIRLPALLPTILIRCAAGAPCLQFSTLELNFTHNDASEKYFCVTNISSVTQDLIMPVTDSDSAFNICLENMTANNRTEDKYQVSMKPGHKVVFEITFTPSRHGSYNMAVPIIIKGSLENSPFNFLKLTGVYLEPYIVCDRNVLYYQTITPREQVSDNVLLNFIAHKENCEVDAEVDADTFSVTFTDKTKVDQSRFTVIAVVTFTPKVESYIESQITFKCTCKVVYRLKVRASGSKSRFETYEAYTKWEAVKKDKTFKSTYPYFPRPSDDTWYAYKLRILKYNLEHGLYAQRFFFKLFLRIPQDVCTIPRVILPRGTLTETHDTLRELPLIELLVYLISPEVRKLIDDGSICPAYEGIEGTVYMYTVYRNILLFLRQYKVHVSQLEPEYLLPYKLYLIYKKRIHQESSSTHENDIMSEDDFYYFTLQCWIDLLLRIHRVFVFDRIVNYPVPKPKKCRTHDIYFNEFVKYYKANKAEFGDYYEREALLLLWVEFHFEKQKSHLWDLEVYTHLKEHRKFRCFEGDMWDGLAFAALIASYCPYLKDDLKGFYPSFEGDEHIFHNSCLTHQTLKKLNIGPNLMPPNLICPSTAEMIMMLCYLYDLLPGFYPVETITMKASLGYVTEHELIVKNDDNVSIAFSTIFFSNESNEFAVHPTLLIIPARRSKSLKITYYAKNVLKKNVVLVLSGDTYGYKPAKNMSFNLCGIPDIFDFSHQFKITVNTFELVTKNILVTSPFGKKYDAEIYFYLGSPTDVPEDISSFLPVNSFFEQSIPTEVSLNFECSFNRHGSANLSMKLCFVSVGEFAYFIYFLNEEFGDFCIKLIITSMMPPQPLEDLEVVIPVLFSTAYQCTCNILTDAPHCECKNINYNCAKLITIEVPYLNTSLRNGLKMMFSSSLREKDYHFWSNLLESSKGFHILRNYLKNTFSDELQPFKYVLRPLVTYSVEFSKPNVNFPKKVKFNNVTIDGTFQLPIHWNRSDIPDEEVLLLLADHTREVRQYRLKFVTFTDMYMSS